MASLPAALSSLRRMNNREVQFSVRGVSPLMNRMTSVARCSATAFLALTGMLTIGVSAGHANDDAWPSWRGPNLIGTAAAGEYPTEWSNDENVLWKVEMPDIGGSTPVVWGEHIFVTANRESKNVVMDIDWEGNVRWERELGAEVRGKHRKGTGCNPSPVTDGNYVFAYYKSGDLGCVDLAGEVVWQRNLQVDFGGDTLWWDLGTSPVLSRNYLIIACIQSDASYIAAFEKATGEIAWKVDRNLPAPEEANQTYSTPQIVEFEGEEVILCVGADHVTANRASDGELIWKVGGLNPTGDRFFRSISSPVASDNIVVAPYARGDSLTAIRLGGQGDVTDSHVIWADSGSERDRKGADVPTPFINNGLLYIAADNGQITCRDLESGEVQWMGKIEGSRTNFSASPIFVDGLIYFTDEDGTTFVFEANQGMQLVSRNELNEFTVASPVLVNGRVLIRTFDHLYCIGNP